MDFAWNETYKIRDGEPISVLPQCDIAQLGMLMNDDYEVFTHRLGMDSHLATIRTCSNKGQKILELWSRKVGPQATIRVLKMNFHDYGLFLSRLNEIAWGFESIFFVYKYNNQQHPKSMTKVPRRVPIKIALDVFFKNIFQNGEAIFEVEGYRDLKRWKCEDFVGKELKVSIKAVEKPEEISTLPGYFAGGNRLSAEEGLFNQETGTFLIRPRGNQNNEYALSSIKNGQVMHFAINTCEETSTSKTQYFLFDDGYKAYSIGSLVEFYKKNDFSSAIDDVPSFRLTKHFTFDS